MIHQKEFFCYKLSQRGLGNAIDFAIFVASSKDVNAWAGIKRVGQDNDGSQRILKDTRVKAIKRFLTKNIANTIPASVIIAFNTGVATFTSYRQNITEVVPSDLTNGLGDKLDWGNLNFVFDDQAIETERPALIVDGQHRIKGMASLDEDIPVLLVALLEASAQEQAFQFVVINNKSQKVPTDNVKAIIRLIDQDESDLSERLRQAGVNYGKNSAMLGDVNEAENSPFRDLLKWPLSPERGGFIDLTTIENCIRYIKTQLPIIKEDDETVKEVFLAMWRAIKISYPDLWGNAATELEPDPIKTKFMSKVNLSALNEYIADKVGNAWLDDKFDLFDMDQIERYCNDVVLRQITQEFWQKEWAYALQDNSVVRNRIKEDITRISQNMKSDKEWYEGLVLVSQI